MLNQPFPAPQCGRNLRRQEHPLQKGFTGWLREDDGLSANLVHLEAKIFAVLAGSEDISHMTGYCGRESYRDSVCFRLSCQA